MTKTRGYLGIDAGTQGLSVIFTDEELRIRAAGGGGYDMVPGLAAGCYEQRPADWEAALIAAMADLRGKLAAVGLEMEVLAIGISGQMHGEVLADAAGTPLGPARLWCDARNEAEGHELTARLGVKMPKRITAARWLWTIRHRPDLATRVAHITTPAGWIAHLLTGGWTLGIGDAAGMFPIDQRSLDYDPRLLADFDALVATLPGSPRVPPLGDLLPAVRRVGADGGTLEARGATLLGLPQGIPVAPAEGDQPAALAGSLIGAAGQVSMSFGTSVVANAVGDRPFQGIAAAIDHFCAPDGKPINMVFLRNGTTAMNTIVEMFGRALPAGGDLAAAFAAVMPQVLAAPDDCGGLAALPFLDDEPGLGVSRGGTAALIGLDGTSATPGNAAKAMLLATIFNLRMGSDLLDAQGFPRTEIILSGGLTKTPGLAQFLADAFHTPVVLLDGAVEGTAWGAALMAKFRAETLAGRAPAWPAFLERHATGTPTRFTPRPQAAAALDRAFARHRKLVAIHEHLRAALDA
jgi:sugar (pentulose or hexulose) kinase